MSSLGLCNFRMAKHKLDSFVEGYDRTLSDVSAGVM